MLISDSLRPNRHCLCHHCPDTVQSDDSVATSPHPPVSTLGTTSDGDDTLPSNIEESACVSVPHHLNNNAHTPPAKNTSM